MLEKICRIETIIHCWWKGRMLPPLWKTVCRFPAKLNVPLLHDSAIAFLSIYSNKLETMSTNPAHKCLQLFNL